MGVGNAERIAETGVEVAGEAQATVSKTVKIQKMFFSRVNRPCLKVINLIVPKAKGSKWRGNKTDTIVISHVNHSLLFALFCDRAGIDGAAHNPAECTLCVAGGGGRRNAGAG